MIACPVCRAGNPASPRFCGNCGSPLAAPRPAEGERRFSTVLFADVVRAAAIAEVLDPEDRAAVMNGAFGLTDSAIARHGRTVSRPMGDAVLALFGARALRRRPGADGPERARRRTAPGGGPAAAEGHASAPAPPPPANGTLAERIDP